MTGEPVDPEAFAEAFIAFMGWAQAALPARDHPLVTRVREYLTEEARERSVVARTLSPFDQVNQQFALDVWMAEPGRTVVVEGLSVPLDHREPSLLDILRGGGGNSPLRVGAPDLIDRPSGPGKTTTCYRSVLLFVEDSRGRYLLRQRAEGGRFGEGGIGLELAGLTVGDAQQVVAELELLRSRHNIYRGQILELASSEDGMAIGFADLPVTSRSDVVLPEAVLRRVERHTLDIAAQRTALLAAGQHLKRGLLLFGPPGTGKTHTMRYIVEQLTGSTVFMLSGRSLDLIGEITKMARELQPSVVVLEDVDLVAEDRDEMFGSGSVLFELLDAMDGAAADADLLFLLTTNRADILEPALAARPGRVDVAVEIGLPDAAARRRLLEVYSRGVPLAIDADETDTVIERMAGVTASFVKELLRRAVLESLTERGSPLTEVTGADMLRALDDLLDSSQRVTRALLGVPSDQDYNTDFDDETDDETDDDTDDDEMDDE
jgi:cell division protease FtsH